MQLIAFVEYIRTQLNATQFNLLFRALVVRDTSVESYFS